MSSLWPLSVVAAVVLQSTVLVLAVLAYYSHRIVSKVPLVSTAAASGPRIASILFAGGLSASGTLIVQLGIALHAVVVGSSSTSADNATSAQLVVPATTRPLILVISFAIHILLFGLTGLCIALTGLVNYDEKEALLHATFTTGGITFAIMSSFGNTILFSLLGSMDWLWLKICSLIGMCVFSCLFYGFYARAHENVPIERVGRGERAFEPSSSSSSSNDNATEDGLRWNGPDTASAASAAPGSSRSRTKRLPLSSEELRLRIPRTLTLAALCEHASVFCYCMFLVSTLGDIEPITLTVRGAGLKVVLLMANLLVENVLPISLSLYHQQQQHSHSSIMERRLRLLSTLGVSSQPNATDPTVGGPGLTASKASSALSSFCGSTKLAPARTAFQVDAGRRIDAVLLQMNPIVTPSDTSASTHASGATRNGIRLAAELQDQLTSSLDALLSLRESPSDWVDQSLTRSPSGHELAAAAASGGGGGGKASSIATNATSSSSETLSSATSSDSSSSEEELDDRPASATAAAAVAFGLAPGDRSARSKKKRKKAARSSFTDSVNANRSRRVCLWPVMLSVLPPAVAMPPSPKDTFNKPIALAESELGGRRGSHPTIHEDCRQPAMAMLREEIRDLARATAVLFGDKHAPPCSPHCLLRRLAASMVGDDGASNQTGDDIDSPAQSFGRLSYDETYHRGPPGSSGLGSSGFSMRSSSDTTTTGDTSEIGEYHAREASHIIIVRALEQLGLGGFVSPMIVTVASLMFNIWHTQQVCDSSLVGYCCNQALSEISPGSTAGFAAESRVEYVARACVLFADEFSSDGAVDPQRRRRLPPDGAIVESESFVLCCHALFRFLDRMTRPGAVLTKMQRDARFEFLKARPPPSLVHWRTELVDFYVKSTDALIHQHLAAAGAPVVDLCHPLLRSMLLDLVPSADASSDAARSLLLHAWDGAICIDADFVVFVCVALLSAKTVRTSLLKCEDAATLHAQFSYQVSNLSIDDATVVISQTHELCRAALTAPRAGT